MKNYPNHLRSVRLALLRAAAALLVLNPASSPFYALEISAPPSLKSRAVDACGSARFLAFMPFIFRWEGETLEIDGDDPGGMTKFGIDARSHPGVDIKNLTKAMALAIYWKEWQQAGCESMPSPFAEIFFNCAVNMGLGRARQFARAYTDPRAFLAVQEHFYRQLARSGPRRAKYLKGWLNRTAALRKWSGL